MWAKSKHKSGFTIVELLIVIVVIGILAAITVVAYSGIQAKTANTQTIEAVGSWVKSIHLFRADTGAYPGQSSCLGSVFPAGICSNLSGSNICWGTGAVGTDTAFNSALRPYTGGSVPVTNSQKINCGGQQYGGAFYYAWSSPPGLYVYLKGNISVCPSIGGVNINFHLQQDDLTLCAYIFEL